MIIISSDRASRWTSATPDVRDAPPPAARSIPANSAGSVADFRDSRDMRDMRDMRDTRDPRDPRDARDYRSASSRPDDVRIATTLPLHVLMTDRLTD
jgi:hypothetical protein